MARRRGPTVADDLFDLGPHGFERDAERLQRLGRYTLTLVDEPEQDVLGADVVVVQQARFFLRQDNDPSGPVGEPFEHVASASRRWGREHVRCDRHSSDTLSAGPFSTRTRLTCRIFDVSGWPLKSRRPPRSAVGTATHRRRFFDRAPRLRMTSRSQNDTSGLVFVPDTPYPAPYVTTRRARARADGRRYGAGRDRRLRASVLSSDPFLSDVAGTSSRPAASGSGPHWRCAPRTRPRASGRSRTTRSPVASRSNSSTSARSTTTT